VGENVNGAYHNLILETIDIWPAYGLGNARKALRELKSALREIYSKKAPVANMYGSQARREANAASDIDLIDVLLINPDEIQPGREIQRLRNILAMINMRYQELASIMPVSEKDYQ
jgi:hypothetical protein